MSEPTSDFVDAMHLTPAHERIDSRLLASLLRARATSATLPLLGLSRQALEALLARHFAPVPVAWQTLAATLRTPQSVREPGGGANHAFVVALHALLCARADRSRDARDIDDVATMLATACLRPDHLWRDLGLAGREDVTALLMHFFPQVARENTQHLRWKRYLAQICALADGREPGPAPGCPGCEDFAVCFAHLSAHLSPHPSR